MSALHSLAIIDFVSLIILLNERLTTMLPVAIVALGLVAGPPVTQPRSQAKMMAANDVKSNAATNVFGALVGASACALAGAGLSAATSDSALSTLGSTGLLDQDILYTDLLVKGYDAGNTFGYAVLALALMIALASPEAWESAATLAIEEVDACLLDYERLARSAARPPSRTA